jgi:DNA-binding response OmpR family regulator
MPRGEPSYEAPALQVADGGAQEPGISHPLDVCIVDDDKEHGISLAKILGSYGFVVQRAEAVRDLLDTLHEHQVAAILCDAHMPDGGAEYLLPLVTALPEAPRIAIVSGDVSDEYLYRLAGLGAQAFFAKPIDIDEVVSWIRAGRGRSGGA